MANTIITIYCFCFFLIFHTLKLIFQEFCPPLLIFLLLVLWLFTFVLFIRSIFLNIRELFKTANLKNSLGLVLSFCTVGLFFIPTSFLIKPYLLLNHSLFKENRIRVAETFTHFKLNPDDFKGAPPFAVNFYHSNFNQDTFTIYPTTAPLTEYGHVSQSNVFKIIEAIDFKNYWVLSPQNSLRFFFPINADGFLYVPNGPDIGPIDLHPQGGHRVSEIIKLDEHWYYFIHYSWFYGGVS